MDYGLHACLNAGHVVPHWVEAGLGGVNLDDLLKLCFASLQLLFPVLALGLAVFYQLGLGVLSFLQHCLNVP